MVVRIVLSCVVVHPIGNKIIVCYVIFTSNCEISFPVTFKATIIAKVSYLHLLAIVSYLTLNFTTMM